MYVTLKIPKRLFGNIIHRVKKVGAFPFVNVVPSFQVSPVMSITSVISTIYSLSLQPLLPPLLLLSLIHI